MKIKNLNKVLKEVRSDKPLQFVTGKDSNGEPIFENSTVGELLANLLGIGFTGMKPIDTVRAYQLSNRIINSQDGTLDINADGVELIKKCVDSNKVGYNAIALGQSLLESGLEIEDNVSDEKK